jgi:hypothetical protein
MKEPLGKAARDGSDARLREREQPSFPSVGFHRRLSLAQRRVLRRCLALLDKIAEIDPTTAQTAREAARWYADEVEPRR